LILPNSDDTQLSNAEITKSKTPYQVLIYYFTLDSISEYNEWIYQLTDSAHCCTRCQNTKNMLKKYSMTCNNQMINELGMKSNSTPTIDEDSNNILLSIKNLGMSKGNKSGITNDPSVTSLLKNKQPSKENCNTDDVSVTTRSLSFSNSNPNFQFQIRRNLSVSILEARELATVDKRKNIEPYVVVLLNDIKKAKTSVKTGSDPFWREEFKFKYVIIQISKKKKKKKKKKNKLFFFKN